MAEATTTLMRRIIDETKSPKPPEITNLPPNSSVVIYYNNKGEDRAAPTSLCYPVYGTDDNNTGRNHRHAILEPDERYRQIDLVVRNYLRNLHYNQVKLTLSSSPMPAPYGNSFHVPDLKFGNETVLSATRKTPNTLHTELSSLGRQRLSLLLDNEVGFYDQRPLDYQYFIMPQSIYDGYGATFLKELKNEVNEIFPQQQVDYDPKIVLYDDYGTNHDSYADQIRLVESKIEEYQWRSGSCAVIMLHNTNRKMRDEDKLAALTIRKLHDKGVRATVIHSKAEEGWYVLREDENERQYVRTTKQRAQRQVTGYLRNVALNKVLLNSWRWPFVLNSPMNADLIIGVDVKSYTTGLIAVPKTIDIKDGQDIHFIPKPGRPSGKKQHEQLSTRNARKYLKEIIELVLRSNPIPPVNIVIHRDGRTYASETKGFNLAIEDLKHADKLPSDANLTVLEIAKTSSVKLRLFDVSAKQEENPQVGDYIILNSQMAFLCSTGRAFPRPGTSRPLGVNLVEGNMSLTNCLEDIYALTTLAWTRPEDCSRYPITIRLNDRFLNDRATEVGEDILEDEDEEDEEIA